MSATISRLTQLPARVTMPAIILRLEGLTLFVGALAAYGYLGYSWWLFALLLLAPDLGTLGYLYNKRAGALAYNLVHTESLPLLIGVASLLLDQPLGLQLALIWAAHIGVDRALGYGLKYADAFTHTHLGEV
jgi:Domain of unknown function (DUF4260)